MQSIVHASLESSSSFVAGNTLSNEDNNEDSSSSHPSMEITSRTVDLTENDETPIVQNNTNNDNNYEAPTLSVQAQTSFLNSSTASDDDGQNCPICFEVWSNSSDHRLVALKCGHLFGFSCIDKWLKGQGSKCPQCNHPAKRSDIRQIFAKCLKVIDTTERDRALQELERERECRRRAELEAAQSRLSLHLARAECQRLARELMETRQYISVLEERNKFQKVNSSGSIPSSQTKEFSSESLDYELVKSLELSKNSGCRVLACSEILGMLVTSQLSSNSIFPGYGIKKVNLLDLKPSEFVKLHNKAIKDMAFHSNDSLVLTASLDRSIKLTNVLTNVIVQSYNVEADAWSCTWNSKIGWYFYVGLSNGTVRQFDTRNPGASVSVLPSTPGTTLPVVALQYVNPPSYPNLTGPLVCRLSNCHFYCDANGSDFSVSPLPLEGHFTSLNYEPMTSHFLVSCRPSNKTRKVTHMLCQLSDNSKNNPGSTESEGDIAGCCCNMVQVCEGGGTQVQISRSKLFLNPANQSSLLVGAGDESHKAALIWDASKGTRVASLNSESPILDILPFQDQDGSYLATLTSNILSFYKWRSTP